MKKMRTVIILLCPICGERLREHKKVIKCIKCDKEMNLELKSGIARLVVTPVDK